MDLQNEDSALESFEDNELITALDSNQTKDNVKSNGSCSNGIHNMGTSKVVDSHPLPCDVQVKESDGILPAGNSENSQPLQGQSPTMGSSPVTKGYGLRKWRRIKRDVVKDVNPTADSNKILKRVLSHSANPTKAVNLMSAENSEGSTGSVNMLRNMGVADGLLIRGTGMEPRFAVGSAFAAGTDSENSEDQSIKSSTAASAPRVRYDLPAVLGYMREKNRIKSLGGKGANSSTQRVQQGKAQAESSKKPRGERIKIEKKNSHSSIESDSRSSDIVFMQGACSLTSNGNKIERSMYYEEENSDDDHAGEEQFGGEVKADDGQENIGDVSQYGLSMEGSWEGKEEKSEDPLIDSILQLQSVQEALESEVQHLREIGKVSSIPDVSTPFEQGNHDSNSSEQFDAENARRSSSLECKVASLTENVKYLKRKLEEAEAMFKMKELRVAELESALISSKLPREESESERCTEFETELEGVYKRKIEVEVEYLTLSRMMQKLRVPAGDQVTLFEQHEAQAGEQGQMLNKLEEVERKAAMLKKQAEKVDKFREDILGTEEVLDVQKRLYKVTSCFFVQLVLLFLVFLLVVLHLSPHNGVVPT